MIKPLNRIKHNVFLINIPEKCGFGGCEKKLIEYIKYMDMSINKATIVTTKDLFSDRIMTKGASLEVRKFPFKLAGSFISRFYHMFNLLYALKPNFIVYVNNSFLQFKIADFLAGFIVTKGNIASLEVLAAPEPPKKTSKRHFMIIPGIGLWWYKRILPITLRGWLCKKIIAVSKEVKERMVNWYYYPANRIYVTYNRVDFDKFCPDNCVKQNMRKEFNIHNSDIVIISVARLDAQKRLDRLINAFNIFYKKYNNTWLIIVGDGLLREELLMLANSKPSNKRIMFLGFREDVSSYLKMSDIFVLSSDTEGLAFAVLEAMASGLIVVSTKVPGPNEIIKDSVNGFLTEQNEQYIADTLFKITSLPREQYVAVANNACEFIRNNFNFEQTLKKDLELFEFIRKC